MAQPIFPGEITDAIIAHADRPTLLSCSLVCSEWLPASRHALFHEIICNHSDIYELLLSRVVRSGTMRPWLASVRHLTLGCYIRSPAVLRSGFCPSELSRKKSPWFCPFIFDFAGTLPNLLSLKIWKANWVHCPQHPSAYLAFSQLPSVQSLEVLGVKFPSWTTFRQLVSSLPSLQNLAIIFPDYDVRAWASDARHPHAVKYMRPALKSLALTWDLGQHSSNTHDVLDWLTRTPTRRELRAISLTHHDAPGTDRLSTIGVGFLSKFAVSLQSLTLTEDFSCPLEDETDLSGLSDCISLVEFTVHHYCWDGYVPPSWRNVAKFMQMLPSSVQKITVSVTGSYDWSASRRGGSYVGQPIIPYEEGLEVLDPILCHQRFEYMSHVSFSALLRDYLDDDPSDSLPLTREKLEDAVRTKLPMLHKREIVEVHFTYTKF